MMARCVSLLCVTLANMSGGSMLTDAMALAVIPARNGPVRALTTLTPVAKRPIMARRWPRSSSVISAVTAPRPRSIRVGTALPIPLELLQHAVRNRPGARVGPHAGAEVDEGHRIPCRSVLARNADRQVTTVEVRDDRCPTLPTANQGAFHRSCELIGRSIFEPNAAGDQPGLRRQEGAVRLVAHQARTVTSRSATQRT